MDGDAFDSLMKLLRTKPAGRDNPWTKEVVDGYRLGLCHIPNNAVKPLAQAVQIRCRWRPTTAELNDLWREISTEPAMSVTDALAEVERLMSKYGDHGQPHRLFPNSRNIFEIGPPAELAQLPPAVQRTVEGFGGWVAMYRETITGTNFRAQFAKMYAAAEVGIAKSDIREIGATYRRSLPAYEQGGELRRLFGEER